jgi:hypothetical protein
LLNIHEKTEDSMISAKNNFSRQTGILVLLFFVVAAILVSAADLDAVSTETFVLLVVFEILTILAMPLRQDICSGYCIRIPARAPPVR